MASPATCKVTPSTSSPLPSAPCLRILGVPVHMVSMQEVLGRMENWIRERRGSHFIAVTSMHGIMESRKHPGFRQILESADLSIPDGRPLVWTAHRRGYPDQELLPGMNLMWAFGELAAQRGYSHFFYGDTEGVLRQLIERMSERLPGFRVAGAYSPPFRPLTPGEDAEIVGMINRARPDVLWVGLGLPKQERWIFEHRDKLEAPVMVAVGAAFKFVSGAMKRAPLWMQEHGLEFIWRLAHEPRRLCHRVLVYGPLFLWRLFLEERGLKKYD